jgi:hypothetical protein
MVCRARSSPRLTAAIDAAQHATTAYAPAAALRYLERAQEIWPQVADAPQRTGIDEVEVSRLAAEARTGPVRLAARSPCWPTPWPSCPMDPIRCAGHSCLSGTRWANGTRGGRPRRCSRCGARWHCFPPGQSSRAHAVVLASLAATLMRHTEMADATEVATGAIAAAQAAGAKDVEADAAITLGSASSYLGPADAGLGPLRSGVRLAPRPCS